MHFQLQVICSGFVKHCFDLNETALFIPTANQRQSDKLLKSVGCSCIVG